MGNLKVKTAQRGAQSGKPKSGKDKRLECLLDSFRSRKSAEEVLSLLEEGARLHREYQQYVSCENLVKMILNGKMFLRRGDSMELDDWRECRKFGLKTRWARTYIGCFGHETAENVAMWWMYGQGREDAVRLTFPKSTFLKWIDVIRESEKVEPFLENEKERSSYPEPYTVIKPILLSDVAYASVRKPIRKDRKGIRVISWDESILVLDNLNRFIRNAVSTGRFKDYEWRFERETRLLLTVKSDGFCPDQIEIPFRVQDFKQFRVTAGPWMPERKFVEMKRRLEAIFRSKGMNSRSFKIERSCLSGALNYRK